MEARHGLAGQDPREPRKRRLIVRGVVAAYVVGAALILTPVGGAIGGTLSGAASDIPVPPAGVHAIPVPPAGVQAAEGRRVAGRSGPLGISLPAGDLKAAPKLVDGQLRRAGRLVASHRSLLSGLRGVGYSIERSGPWTTIDRPGSPSRLIGAALVLRLDRPVRLRGIKLPTAHYDVSQRRVPPYQSAVTTVSAEEVTQLELRVDLRGNKVASIEPHPLSSKNLSIRAPKGFVRKVRASEEGR